MSPFMSSMLAAPLLEMPPVSKHTPLPMKATGAASFLPPFQRMITVRLSCVEPCPTPRSAFMPSLFIPDHGGGARHVAFHVLHVGGPLARDAAGIETHALADEGDRRGVLLAAVPAHDHGAALVRRALPDAEERVHA